MIQGENEKKCSKNADSRVMLTPPDAAQGEGEFGAITPNSPRPGPFGPRVQTVSYKSRQMHKAFASILTADGETRTLDPFITSEVLYRLSYIGLCP